MTESTPLLYLLDVEGTVAPLTLTTHQLFPYARRHFCHFLRDNLEDPAVRADLKLLAEEGQKETEPDAPGWLRSLTLTGFTFGPNARMQACLYLSWLMDRDRKSTALKSLQGKIWKAGFESGELKGTLFADVPAAFRRWSEHGKVAIYSSGSVEAQKLLFGHTVFGDLRPLIMGYFDTRTGPKMVSASYVAIAKAMGIAPADAVFFSDTVKELDAARKAGMQTRLVAREGNQVVENAGGHERVESFAGM
jgi:enolase-phosphatase E1